MQIAVKLHKNGDEISYLQKKQKPAHNIFTFANSSVSYLSYMQAECAVRGLVYLMNMHGRGNARQKLGLKFVRRTNDFGACENVESCQKSGKGASEHM